jgi:hypothetical protein
LLVGIAALSVPIFVATMNHLSLFRFERWQAWAWVLLFGIFPLAAGLALWWGRRVPVEPISDLGTWARLMPAVYLGYAVVAATGAVVLWASPEWAARWVPVSEFGGRVLGGWLWLAAAMAGPAGVSPAWLSYGLVLLLAGLLGVRRPRRDQVAG